MEDVITSSHQDPDVRGSTQFIDALALLKSGFVLNAAEPQMPQRLTFEYLQVNETHLVLNFSEFVNNFIFLIS